MAVDKLIWKIILDFFILVCGNRQCGNQRGGERRLPISGMMQATSNSGIDCCTCWVQRIVSFPLLAMMLWAEPNYQGYFANDTSIRLPYKEERIPVGPLAGTGFAINIIAIIIIEVIRDKQGKGIGEKFLSGSVLPGWVWESYHAIGVFTFGASCQQLTADLAKYVIGRLRPHFIDVCKPFPILNSDLNRLGYIQDYVCAGNDADIIKEARLSFPSAHCSFTMYCAVFFIFYLQVKGKWRGSKLLRHGLQFLVMMVTWFIGLTRVQDHMHHWGDVAVGFLIGATFACLVFIYVLKPKKYSNLPMTWEEPQVPTNNLGLPRAVLAR